MSTSIFSSKFPNLNFLLFNANRHKYLSPLESSVKLKIPSKQSLFSDREYDLAIIDTFISEFL